MLGDTLQLDVLTVKNICHRRLKTKQNFLHLMLFIFYLLLWFIYSKKTKTAKFFSWFATLRLFYRMNFQLIVLDVKYIFVKVAAPLKKLSTLVKRNIFKRTSTNSIHFGEKYLFQQIFFLLEKLLFISLSFTNFSESTIIHKMFKTTLLVYMQNSALRKKFNFCFSRVFC